MVDLSLEHLSVDASSKWEKMLQGSNQVTLLLVYTLLLIRIQSKIDSLVCSDFSAFERINPKLSYSMTRAFTANEIDTVYANGQAFSFLKGSRETTHEFVIHAEKLINDGILEHVPLQVYPGGLSGIIDAFQVIRSGQVSTEKLVIRI